MHELNRVMPAESVLVTDGGFASHWGGLLYDCKAPGRRFVADRGFASIGYGLPGGIGARLGTPDTTPVVALTGDGGLNMTLGSSRPPSAVGRPLTLVRDQQRSLRIRQGTPARHARRALPVV